MGNRLSITLLLALLPIAMVIADESADPWQQKKAERFKPISQQEQQAIADAVPSQAVAEPKKARRALVFYRCEGFIHTSIPHGNLALQEMAKKTAAFTVDLADTYDVFTEQNLKQYDCIVLNNTTGMQFRTPAQLLAFMDFINSGKGLVGIHAASDNFGRHPECRDIIGGIFGGHPWNAGGNWAFRLDDPDHVLNRAFDGKGFWHKDEIYQYKSESYQGPKVLRLLVSLDMTKDEVSKQINDGPRDVPVSWIRTVGDGRVFYTNFGHREDTFSTPAIMQHLLDGIQYAMGDLSADATPTADASTKEPALAPELP